MHSHWFSISLTHANYWHAHTYTHTHTHTHTVIKREGGRDLRGSLLPTCRSCWWRVIDCYKAWPLLLMSREEKWWGERRGNGRRENLIYQSISLDIISHHIMIWHHIMTSYNIMESHSPDPAPPHETNFLPIKPSTGWNHHKVRKVKKRRESKWSNRKVE